MARMPKSRLDFWRPKLEGNRQRDLCNQGALASMGWEVLVVWECETKDAEKLTNRLLEFLMSKAEDEEDDERH